MSLATRCTACGTVFRVVQDQLKVSEGWVRCGRCNDVFNALEGLFDLERDTPPVWRAGVPDRAETPVAASDTSAPRTAATNESVPDHNGPSLGDKIDAQLMGSRESAQDSTPATRINERDRRDFPDAQFDPDMLNDDTAYAVSTATETPWAVEPQGEVVDSPNPPAFVEHAHKRARLRSPAMRVFSGLASAVLLVALAGQVVHHFRDSIGARWPVASTSLSALCAAMSCTIGAPRRIDDLAVESTALARVPLLDAFKLSVVLRNRGAAAVALPSVDLTLTDANGQLVARRMLAPQDFRAAAVPVVAGAESALQLLFAVAGAPVTGYTVEVFYP